MKKKLAALAIAAPLIAGGLSGCGGGQYHTVAAQQTYCVDSAGHVVDPSWCNVGNVHYNPSVYVFWMGDSHGHSYHRGSTIPRSYYRSGKRINPSSASARKAAGLPATGTVRSGSSPAKSQTAPSRNSSTSKTSVGGSTSRSSTTSRTSVGGSTSRSSGGFSGSRSSGGRR